MYILQCSWHSFFFKLLDTSYYMAFALSAMLIKVLLLCIVSCNRVDCFLEHLCCVFFYIYFEVITWPVHMGLIDLHDIL